MIGNWVIYLLIATGHHSKIHYLQMMDLWRRWLSHPSEKYEFVSWDDDIPHIWENHRSKWGFSSVSHQRVLPACQPMIAISDISGYNRNTLAYLDMYIYIHVCMYVM